MPPEQVVLQWKVSAAEPVDPAVHTVGEGLEQQPLPAPRCERRPSRLGRGREPELPAPAIDRQKTRTRELGEPSGTGTPLQFHLQQPVAGDRIPETADGVGLAGCEDVGNAAVVEADAHRSRQSGDAGNGRRRQFSLTADAPDTGDGVEKRTDGGEGTGPPHTEREQTDEHHPGQEVAEVAGLHGWKRALSRRPQLQVRG